MRRLDGMGDPPAQTAAVAAKHAPNAAPPQSAHGRRRSASKPVTAATITNSGRKSGASAAGTATANSSDRAVVRQLRSSAAYSASEVATAIGHSIPETALAS